MKKLLLIILQVLLLTSAVNAQGFYFTWDGRGPSISSGPTWVDPYSENWISAWYFGSSNFIYDSSTSADGTGLMGRAVVLYAPGNNSNALCYINEPNIEIQGVATAAVNSAFEIGTNQFCMTFWLKTDIRAGGQLRMMDKYYNSSARWRITADNGVMSFYADDGTPTILSNVDGPLVPTNEWAHWAFRFVENDTNETAWYMNGVKLPSNTTLADDADYSVPNKFILGKYVTSYAGSFYMDRLIMYKNLTAAAILEISQNSHPVTGIEVPPVEPQAWANKVEEASCVLILGQSNAVGAPNEDTALTAEQKVQSRDTMLLFRGYDPRTVQVLENGGDWSAEIMAAYLNTLRRTNRTAIIKVAVGGRAISTFLPGGDMYTAFTNYYPGATSVLSNQFRFQPAPDFYIHIGGEQEAADETAASACRTNLTHCVQTYRDFTGRGTNMMFILPRLSISNGAAFAGVVRTNLQAAVEENITNAVWIDCDGFELRDGTHYSDDGMKDLGTWLGSNMIHGVSNHP